MAGGFRSPACRAGAAPCSKEPRKWTQRPAAREILEAGESVTRWQETKSPRISASAAQSRLAIRRVSIQCWAQPGWALRFRRSAAALHCVPCRRESTPESRTAPCRKAAEPNRGIAAQGRGAARWIPKLREAPGIARSPRLIVAMDLLRSRFEDSTALCGDSRWRAALNFNRREQEYLSL